MALAKQTSLSQKSHEHTTTSILQTVKTILCEEAHALTHLAHNIPNNIQTLISKIINTQGKIVFSGNGKSGIIARKLVATFSSLGIPSFFLHPSDALHGDLGMIQKTDLFICLSKSGNGKEFEHIFSFLKTQKNTSVLLCCDKGTLYNKADLALLLTLKKEACPLNLAPTSSSTLMMAFGDALAIAINEQKGFTQNDFARFHPAGTLGKKLLMTVNDLMYKESDLPFLYPESAFANILVAITGKKLGVGIVVNHDKKLLGIITDGDLRRACKLGPVVFTKTAADIMTPQPKTIHAGMQASKALAYMETHKITSLVVTDIPTTITTKHKNKTNIVTGLLHIHDLIKAGL